MDVNFIRQVLRDVLSSPQSAAPRTVRVEDIRHSSWVGNMLSILGFLPQVQLAPPFFLSLVFERCYSVSFPSTSYLSILLPSFSSSPLLLPPLLSSPLLLSFPLLSSPQGRVVYLPVDAIDLTLLQQAMHIVEGIELAVARSAIPVASTEEEDEDHMITDQSDPSSAEGYLPAM